MNKRNIISVVLVLGLTMALFAGGKSESASADKPVEVKIAFNQSEEHPQYKAMEEMGIKFSEATGGAYTFDIQPNELLGDQRAASELVQINAIQMALVGNPIVENYNKDFAVIGLPYIYDSMDHQKAVFVSGILDDLFASTAANGFQVIGAFTAGARSVYTDKPIETPEDLAGYKVRVMESETMVKMLNYMGGVGTPMGQGEVYTAIQQGVLEGGENNEVTYTDLKHYEVAPYFSYTSHLMVPDLIIASTDFLAGMSEEHRAIFYDLMNETIESEFAIWDEKVTESKAVAIENGATFIDVDIAPFQKNAEPLAVAVTSSSSTAKKLYEDIRALAP